MLVTKLKIATVVLLALGVLLPGAGTLTHRALAEPPTKSGTEQVTAEKAAAANAEPEPKKEPAPPDKKEPAPPRKKGGEVGKLDAVDADKGTVTVTVTSKDGRTQQRTLEVGRDAEILVDGKGAKLGDLKQGSQVVLTLSQVGKGETPKLLAIQAGQARPEGNPAKKESGQPPKKDGDGDE